MCLCKKCNDWSDNLGEGSYLGSLSAASFDVTQSCPDGLEGII